MTQTVTCMIESYPAEITMDRELLAHGVATCPDTPDTTPT